MPTGRHEQARHYRRLAKDCAAPRITDLLRQLASEFEAEAAGATRKPDEIWVTRHGIQIPVQEMSEAHAKAVLRKLIRRYGNRLTLPEA